MNKFSAATKYYSFKNTYTALAPDKTKKLATSDSFHTQRYMTTSRNKAKTGRPYMCAPR